jgi:hypothetical protein
MIITTAPQIGVAEQMIADLTAAYDRIDDECARTRAVARQYAELEAAANRRAARLKWLCVFFGTAAALLAVAFTAGAAILVLGGK